jgi:hypothetical protein
MPYVWLLVDTYEKKKKEHSHLIIIIIFLNERAQDDLYDIGPM